MKNNIYKKIISTPIGDVIVCIIEDGVCFFDFTDRKQVDYLLNDMQKKLKRDILEQDVELHKKVETQTKEYFAGKRKEFDLPLVMTGTAFQEKVWQELLRIPYGKTISYLEEAKNMGIEKSVRAVANANGKNKLSVIIPCHRVVASNGKLGGYGGGLERKKWLLGFENQNIS